MPIYSPTHAGIAADPGAVTQALVQAAAGAGYAPSIHHTQPWRWRLTGDRLDLHIERSRVLNVTDPNVRLATLSCGAALHHVRISPAAQGWHVAVARMPNPADADHLAEVRLNGRVPIDRHAVRGVRSIGLRHT